MAASQLPDCYPRKDSYWKEAEPTSSTEEIASSQGQDNSCDARRRRRVGSRGRSQMACGGATSKAGPQMEESGPAGCSNHPGRLHCIQRQ